MNLREAAQQALEALDCPGKAKTESEQAAITALKQTLAEPEQDKFCDTHCTWRDHHPDCVRAEPEQGPVAWELRKGKTDRVLLEITNDARRAHDWKCSLEEVVPLYTAPAPRKPLTEEEIVEIAVATQGMSDFEFARAIERAHGIGGSDEPR